MNNLIKELEAEGIKAEIEKRTKESINIDTFNNKLDKFDISNNVYYLIKAIFNDKNITLTVNDINDIKNIIEAIKSNAMLLENDDKTSFAKNIEIEEKIINREKIDINHIKEYLLSLGDLKNKYKYLDTIMCSFSYIKSGKAIVNSETELNDKNEAIYFYSEFVLKENNRTETSSYSLYTDKFEENKIIKELEQKLTDSYLKLSSTTISGKMNIIIKNEIVFGILESFISGFYKKSIREGTSAFSNYINKKMFSDKITIVEDPSNTKMVVSRLFDSEGNKTYYKEIVKNGVFQTILYDNKEAIKENTNPTGNSKCICNLHIKNGDKTFDSLICDMQEGVIIDEVSGLHCGIDTITGDISLQCEGIYIKQGKIQKRVKMFVMSSNIFELFNNVIEVGNDLTFFSETGGSPSLLIKDINIVGKSEE